MEVWIWKKGVSVAYIGVILGEVWLYCADDWQLRKVILECMGGDVAKGGCS
jgi:DUF2075 family protein